MEKESRLEIDEVSNSSKFGKERNYLKIKTGGEEKTKSSTVKDQYLGILYIFLTI